MTQNKGLIFKKVPNGWPVKGQDLTIEDRPIDLNQDLADGSILVKNYYVSFDPYQRGRLRSPEIKSYAPPATLGEPITNSAVSKVLKSANSKFAEGDVIHTTGTTPTEEYSVLPKAVADSAHKMNNPYNIDPKAFIGALGMPGLTAYSSFYEIGQPQKGETIFISAASGAVGQIVGQLAKHEGLTVIGSVGDDAKLDYIKKDLGFDGGFNYKKQNVVDALAKLAPKGIDIYYDNVGGEQLDAALGALNPFGRIVACGAISQYNVKPGEGYGVKNTMMIVGKRIKYQGFIVSDKNMGPKYAADHQKNVQKWISDGSFKIKMSETKGIDNAIDGLLGMFKGENFGKAVLTIDELK